MKQLDLSTIWKLHLRAGWPALRLLVLLAWVSGLAAGEAGATAGTGAPVGVATGGTLVVGPTITVAPTSLPYAGIGRSYNATVTASGGTAPYTFRIVAGGLPAGLTLSAGGVLSGIPTEGGTAVFTVYATDSSPSYYSGSFSYVFTVASPYPYQVGPSSPADGIAGQPYTQVFTTSGGTAPYSYSQSGGTLPPGLSLSANGTLSGTPTASGTFRFNLRARDSSTGSGPYSTDAYAETVLVIAPPVRLEQSIVSTGGVGRGYYQQLTATGGTAPYTFAIASGRLLAGLTLSAGGVLSGIPTEGGTASFTVRTTDSSTGTGRYVNTPPGPYSSVANLVISISGPNPYQVGPRYPSDGTAGQPYTQVFGAYGGTSPYTISKTGGTLPPGLSLSANGTLSGTPTASGTFSFSLRARDSSTGFGPYDSDNYTITLVIQPPAIALGAGTPPAGTVGTAFSHTFTASGGTAPYTYTLAAGALPAGLTLGTDGKLSGTPTAGGSFPITVRATDATGGGTYSGTGGFTLVMAAPTLVLTPAALPDGAAGSAYSQSFSTGGGTAPYSYTLTAGALPAGLSLSAGGTLAGTPTESGTFSFTVSATDASTGTGPYSAAKAYALYVVAAPPAVASITRLTASPTATATVQYEVRFTTAVAGVSAANFSVDGPTGAAVSSVSGTGTAYTVVVSTGTGSGTLRLNVANSTGLTPQVVSLPYTAGPAYTITKSFAAPPRLTLRGAGNLGGTDDVTAFVDAVQVLQNNNPVTGALQNGSFETSNVAERSHRYADNVVATPWTFSETAGVARSNSAFGAAPSPDGDAVAFLQSSGGQNGSISQLVTVPAGSYQVSFRTVQRDYSAKNQVVNVFLDNVLLGSIQPASTTVYDTFTSSAVEVAAPLPVELSAFTATLAGPAAVRLAWATASEKNSQAFEIERSLDGQSFGRIGTVPAAGSSSSARRYEQLDTQVLNALGSLSKAGAGQASLYYRLKQLDTDGTFSYSPVRSVSLTPALPSALTLFPNPAHGAATLTGAQPGVAVTVLDALGRPVLSVLADAAGQALLALPAGLPTGVYVVRSGIRAVRLTVE
ncbi:T9SS type A sorting domain-containing protein [Hymenobacter sp. BT442]|uniref:T9SS type A sorting domain-containing protein n=2 Tax=Hymenobacter negativus TaxID=2795026 RepID=A0ABS0QDE7_9BACT|nr:T9SS type A sorting domain-containing protein [Hymenobacter negativus]